jgi:hypothetical protein
LNETVSPLLCKLSLDYKRRDAGCGTAESQPLEHQKDISFRKVNTIVFCIFLLQTLLIKTDAKLHYFELPGLHFKSNLFQTIGQFNAAELCMELP